MGPLCVWSKAVIYIRGAAGIVLFSVFPSRSCHILGRLLGLNYISNTNLATWFRSIGLMQRNLQSTLDFGE